MNIPAELRYTQKHEWVRIEGSKAYIGITDFAQHSLGDIVFVELPEEGMILKAGDSLGVVESVKAVSDVYCPLSGTVGEVNRALIDYPEKINQAPYENWMAVIEVTDPGEVDKLLTPEQYEETVKNESQ